MTVPFKIHTVQKHQYLSWGSEAGIRAMLVTLWQRRALFAAVAAVLFSIGLIGTLSIPTTYKSTATLELTFNKDEPAATSNTKPITAMDPGALVNGAAQNIASRANASRVVNALRLDEDPDYRGGSIFGRLKSAVASSLGLTRHAASPHELAIDGALRNLKVEYKPHLYVISVTYMSDRPETATRMANSFTLEHLRGERLKELKELWLSSRRELVALSEGIGERHPRYIETSSRVEHLAEQIEAVKAAEANPDRFLLAGQTPILAESSAPPSNLRLMLIFLVLSAAIATGVVAALAIERAPIAVRKALARIAP